ncbi:MAG: alginate lyase family protein [Hyphomicrobiales bacterium]|nr:alginate lyase family protein [Hyphomicrobiales bacterium]
MKRSTQRAAVAAASLLIAAAQARAAACPADGPVVRDIAAEAFYTDAKFSIVDPAVEARNRESLRALDKTLWAIVYRSDRFLASGSPEDAACALALLAHQAAGGAMLGTMSSRQAGYERKWRTAGMAIVYLGLRERASQEERTTIEPWLGRLADAVEATDTRPEHWNNHHYWIGLVDTAVGAATGDEARFARGRKIYDDGLAAIAADGTLPREMERGRRALHYHAYAAAPLTLSAAIAARRGEDWWERRDGALHRLVGRVVAGLEDPAWFAARTGVESEPAHPSALAWIALYARRFPGRVPEAAAPGPHRSSWLGGDLDALARRWMPGTAGGG